MTGRLYQKHLLIHQALLNTRFFQPEMIRSVRLTITTAVSTKLKCSTTERCTSIQWIHLSVCLMLPLTQVETWTSLFPRILLLVTVLPGIHTRTVCWTSGTGQKIISTTNSLIRISMYITIRLYNKKIDLVIRSIFLRTELLQQVCAV